MAEHAKSTITNAAGVPWARAPGRWFIQGLVATADKVAWLEYPSESEGRADLIEQSFTTDATNGPCAAQAAPTSGK